MRAINTVGSVSGVSGLAGAAAAVGLVMAVTPSSALASTTGGGAEAKGTFSYAIYAEVLEVHVDDAGMVDYKGLLANRSRLDSFARALAELKAKDQRTWTPREKIAFWINAYNALTLVAIIDHYPVKASGWFSWRYPSNSIRQIPGVWKKLRFKVVGKDMTLDQIEHETLRARFNEPRIHVALVCAAMGCPTLRNEPFVASRLEAQLDDQARGFLAHPLKFRIDRRRGRVHLSSIFKWFGDDFVKTYGTDESFKGHGESERAVLNFASRHLKESDRKYLEEGRYSISYLDYDWTLNEQKHEVRAPAGSAARAPAGSGRR